MELVGLSATELGGVKEVSFSVEGEGVYSRMKYESGVHRVQRVPETETQGRVHTSTVTVAVMPQAEDVEVHIDPADLRIDTFRSSGGGRAAHQQDLVRHPRHAICPRALWRSARTSAANIKTRKRL